MPDLIQETRQKFIPQPTTGDAVLKARVGDRMIVMAITGDLDVVEVILTRKNHVVARCLTSDHLEQGSKYQMPIEFMGMWPAPLPYGTATLFRTPEHAGEDDGVAQAAAPKRTRPAPGESKLDKCKAIFAANREADKTTVVKMFVEQAGCTPAGANTYYLTCKKVV